MPLGRPLTGRAETRTPEPPDGNEREESPPRVRPKCIIRPPNSYAREQEEQIEINNTRPQRVKNPRGRPRNQSDAPAGREAPTPEGTPTDSEEPNITKLLTELSKLKEETRRRGEARQEELQRVTAALAKVQQELNKNKINKLAN
ncbi:unnamed protein product [Aspergillus oryzae var. brunneus]|uniref:Unnamed protein product n=1 Tax=Aspergillus oryzae var. brunneus TaxID=332754 RepID=A0ABQ6LBL8_ASPOZ|nr:unnamed protein product [Aspergillus oryzae]GMG55501.1 unnamed protein product [Aspergillus oryzae var. brunneus]